ncbi:MAG: cation:proton antiporter [Candidatus Spechtbacterales bacterium]
MEQLPAFFIVLTVGLIFSELFRRLHLPWVLALIIGGMYIGPFGVGFFTPNETMDFLAEMGLVFLLFMAGLETRLSSFGHIQKRILLLALLNGLIPFVLGLAIAAAFGYALPVAILLGAIFVSSSIAVIVPSLEASRLVDTRLGRTILTAAILEDIVSLIILSVFLQTSLEGAANIPLLLFYPLAVGALIVLRLAIPAVEKVVSREIRSGRDIFENELRLVFVLLLGIVALLQLLGLHPVIAGFFAGLVLSDTIKSDVLREKLHTLSYGLFIPIFFIVLGANTNIRLFTTLQSGALFAGVIIIGSIVAKLASGFIGGKLNHFTTRQSFLVGAATIPQLSTAVAVASLAPRLDIPPAFISSIIVLSIATTFVGPLLIRLLARRTRTKEIMEAYRI